MQKGICILFFLAVADLISCDSSHGQEIVQKLYQHRNKCKEPLGGNWVPLPSGLNCGLRACDFPKEWCVIKGKNGIPDLFCESLDSSCQEILKEGVKAEPSTKLISSASAEKSQEEDKEEEKATEKPKKLTSAPKTETETAAKSSSPCEDLHELCCFWAAGGECDRNPLWMKRACRKSCGVCSCSFLNAELCQTHLAVEDCRWLTPFSTGPAALPETPKTRLLLFPQPRPAAPPAPPTAPPAVAIRPRPSLADCEDRQPLCRVWASTGQCGLNRIYMAINCPVSCGLCS